MNRNAEPEDTAQARLRLLCRTLRDDGTGLSSKLQILKTSYMTREGSKPDLARIVAVTPNLRYVDLPEGVFMDDASCNTLKQEIQGRCPDLRKMVYMGGSERSLELLARGTLWRNLEVLELSQLDMDPTILRHALGSLHHLKALKISDIKSFDDQIFQHNDYLPPWPALAELTLSHVAAEGLVEYLSRPDTQDTLKSLSLTATGIRPTTLQHILATAPRLTHLSIIDSVAVSFPAGVQPLSSTSLRTLHYEITTASSAGSYSNPSASYYAYLSSSLLSNGLPALRKLYVRVSLNPLSIQRHRSDISYRIPDSPSLSSISHPQDPRSHSTPTMYPPLNSHQDPLLLPLFSRLPLLTHPIHNASAPITPLQRWQPNPD
jgi:hypothetical protein